MAKKLDNKSCIVLVRSDLQGGSSLGLLHPETLLERADADNNPYFIPVELNPVQKYLWDINKWAVGEVFALAGDRDIHYFENGDMTQGNHFSDGLVSGREEDHVTIACDLINDVAKDPRVKTVRLTKSTGVHAFKENSGDTSVATRLKYMLPQKDIRLVGHGLANVGGVLIDYAHHGPPGGVRSWLKGNLMRLTVRSIVDQAMKDNQPIPQVILRAHKHERVEEWVVDWRMDERIKSVGITTPSMQMLNEHARKVTNSEQRVTNGLVALEIEGGKVKDVHWFAQTKYIAAAETL